MYQKPRTREQQEMFDNALKIMGDLYASAIGTTVLQYKEIPPRPSEFEGTLRLGELVKATEHAIRHALHRFGDIVSCEIDGVSAVVRFTSHAAAEAAVAAGPGELCVWLGLLYNDRPYNDRGW